MLRSNLNTINARIFNKTAIRIDDQALREVEACYRFLEKFEQGKVIYGINTGFGPMAQYRIGDADLNSLQYNIIRSHSCGAGEALPDICVRAAMLARLQTFLNAKSGVHPDVVRILADFLNNEIYPLVPRHGSVGASGDLVQLAHIALALIGEAEVSFRGETVPAAEAMAACGITPLNAKSGVHPDVVRILADFLNNEIYPLVPRHGSVGASGDLVQLAHIALALIGEAEVSFRGETVPAAEAMAACGITPLRLRIRDGLALTNGTAVMTGIGLVNLAQARRLLGWAVKASVMLNEIVESYDDFMAGALNEYKLHAGQIEIARQMRAICATSRRLRKREAELYSGDTGAAPTFRHKVQPYYSLRCIPQILGPVLETISQAEKILVEEFNAVDDNPVVDPAAGTIYHGGNFHGDYVSLEMDKLKIAVTKMTMLAERQLNYLFHDRINETLPPFVNLGKLGLNYGLQAAQFTATSTTAESQTLSNPMYVHSIPNNNDNQDIVSMGTNAAMLTRQVVENGYQVAAIEMLALVQAADYLQCAGELSDATRQLYADIRGIVPRFADDTPKHREIAAIENFLKNNSASL